VWGWVEGAEISPLCLPLVPLRLLGKKERKTLSGADPIPLQSKSHSPCGSKGPHDNPEVLRLPIIFPPLANWLLTHSLEVARIFHPQLSLQLSGTAPTILSSSPANLAKDYLRDTHPWWLPDGMGPPLWAPYASTVSFFNGLGGGGQTTLRSPLIKRMRDRG
jgi:hypothetical protein